MYQTTKLMETIRHYYKSPLIHTKVCEQGAVGKFCLFFGDRLVKVCDTEQEATDEMSKNNIVFVLVHVEHPFLVNVKNAGNFGQAMKEKMMIVPNSNGGTFTPTEIETFIGGPAKKMQQTADGIVLVVNKNAPFNSPIMVMQSAFLVENSNSNSNSVSSESPSYPIKRKREEYLKTKSNLDSYPDPNLYLKDLCRHSPCGYEHRVRFDEQKNRSFHSWREKQNESAELSTLSYGMRYQCDMFSFTCAFQRVMPITNIAFLAQLILSFLLVHHGSGMTINKDALCVYRQLSHTLRPRGVESCFEDGHVHLTHYFLDPQHDEFAVRLNNVQDLLHGMYEIKLIIQAIQGDQYMHSIPLSFSTKFELLFDTNKTFEGQTSEHRFSFGSSQQLSVGDSMKLVVHEYQCSVFYNDDRLEVPRQLILKKNYNYFFGIFLFAKYWSSITIM